MNSGGIDVIEFGTVVKMKLSHANKKCINITTHIVNTC